MEGHRGSDKKSSVLKKLERYFPIRRKGSSGNMLSRSRSCNSGASSSKHGRRVAPDGCFPVYVGPEKEKFTVRIKYANHPLFRMLLEDAEMEYGFNSEGPILLPCDVDLFYKVLAEMDSEEGLIQPRFGCDYGSSCAAAFTPRRHLTKSRTTRDCRSYSLLTPPRSLKADGY